MVLSPRFAWYQTPGNGNATHRICLYWFPRKIACQPALSRHTAFSGVRERSLPLDVSTFRQISPSDLLTIRPYKSSRVCADQCAASPRRGDGIPDRQYLPSGLIYIPSMFILGAIFHETGLIWAQPVADVLSLLLAIGLYFRMSGKGND